MAGKKKKGEWKVVKVILDKRAEEADDGKATQRAQDGKMVSSSKAKR